MRSEVSAEDLQCIRCLERADRGGNRPEHACRFTRGLHSSWRLRNQTAETAGLAREDGHGQSIAAHRGSIYPRDAALDGEIIDEVTRFEVVGGVHDQANAVEKVLDVARRHIRHPGLDLNGGIDGLQATGGGDRFRTDLARSPARHRATASGGWRARRNRGR